MRIPWDAKIDDRKLTNYLLVERPWDDKSADAIEDRSNDYGMFYRVEGALKGPTDSLQVVCVWMKRAIDGRFHFVTLKPSTARRGSVSATL